MNTNNSHAIKSIKIRKKQVNTIDILLGVKGHREKMGFKSVDCLKWPQNPQILIPLFKHECILFNN